MDAAEFTEFSKHTVDFITNYLENIRTRRVIPEVQPGYLRPLLPDAAPEKPEKWQDVLADLDKVIMPGISHWHSPRFHGYFPTGNSYPAVVAEMLSSALAVLGVTWITSPVCTELEVVTMDWLGKMIGLPEDFLACSGGNGGGVIQGTASESTLVALLGARSRMLKKLKDENPSLTDDDIVPKLVSYCSEQAHSSVERAGMLGGVKMRILEVDNKRRFSTKALEKAIRDDRAAGLIPFYVVATLGTTPTCAFDNIDEIGDIAVREGLWLHIDAAYAGSAFICPEYRYLMKGIEKVDTFNFNPHKWLNINFDCAAMWFKDTTWFINAYKIDPVYLKHNAGSSVPEYRHWQIPFGRRFRSLKLWFVLRIYGVELLQEHIRKQIGLAHYIEGFIKADDRLEIYEEVLVGLVCFRVKGSNAMNEALLKKINERGNIFMVSAFINNQFILRFCICSRYTEKEDIDVSWKEISHCTDEVFREFNA